MDCKLDCGCLLFYNKVPDIVFCPLHEHAKELYEALKDSTAILKLTLQLTMTPQGERAMTSMIEQNEKAIAKVKRD